MQFWECYGIRAAGCFKSNRGVRFQESFIQDSVIFKKMKAEGSISQAAIQNSFYTQPIPYTSLKLQKECYPGSMGKNWRYKSTADNKSYFYVTSYHLQNF